MPWTRSGWWPSPRVFGPIHGRLAFGAVALLMAGAGLLSGWGLVREGGDARSGDSPYRLPAPGWLPVMGGVLAGLGAIALVAIQASAPVSRGERLPEHLRRPVDERSWPIFVAMLAPFDIGLVVTSIVATESSDRWEPLGFAVAITVVAPLATLWAKRASGQ